MAELERFFRRGEFDYRLLAQKIREKRRSLGLGLREAAGQCRGLSYSTLSRLEHGSARPDHKTLKQVIAWLDISPSSLFMGAQPIRAHLRAKKNLNSTVAEALAKVARSIGPDTVVDRQSDIPSDARSSRAYRRLSHQLREDLAVRFREAVHIDPDSPLDPFNLDVQGARVVLIHEIETVPASILSLLTGPYSRFWSAMTIPLNDVESEWLIVLNSTHTPERRRSTLMEEICHILLGHNLCILTHVEGQTFRDYDKDQETDAFGLGAAILIPKTSLVARVRRGEFAESIAKHFRVSSELVEYRIKISGAWYEYQLQQHVKTK